MSRKSALACAVSLVLLPGAAGALGLGSIRAHSALDEPFSGEIELLDVAPDQIGTVKVRLAPKSEFDKVGAPRSGFLKELSFAPVLSPEGSPVILVTSTAAVREPYLDFLIEAESSAGRTVKEYTVLLDPPVTLDRPPPRVDQPEIELRTPQRSARKEPSPLREQAAAASVATADSSAFPMHYGPVHPGEGLWKIAKKMADRTDTSLAQAAMALYRANQQAFIGGDINKLKVGAVLVIPTSAELLALDVAAADREFGAALRGERVASTPLTDIEKVPEPEARLEIAGTSKPDSSVPAAAQPPVEVPPEGLKTEPGAAVPGTAGKSAAQGADKAAQGLGEIKRDLLLVQEAGESTRQETAELRRRIRELETQLASIQRLLKLSNERIAQLRTAGPDRTGQDLGSRGADEVPVQEAGKIAEASGEGGGSGTHAAPARTEASPVESDSRSGAGARAPGSPTSPGFWESIPQPMSALAAVALLLLVLGWTIYRRRKSLEATPKPVDLAGEVREAGGAVAATEYETDESTTESTDASTSTSSPYSGFGALEEETEEGDIVSEADVYIAYGRYREAESLLEEELDRSPDRLDVKFKLAEAYHRAGNLAGLEAMMSQARQAGADRSDSDQWRRLEGMVRDLKGGGGDGAEGAVAGDGIFSAFQGKPPIPERTGPVPKPLSKEQGFSSTGEASSGVVSISGPGDLRSQDLDLEVEDLEIVGGAFEVPESEEAPDVSEGGAASDLELQLEDLESLRDLDLSSLSDELSAVEQPSAGSKTSRSDDAEKRSLDIPSVGKDSLTSDVLSSQWQTDSGMWDEVATKLDLARAYIEMEDPEAARVILEEVAQEGNQDQRAEAAEMMARLH